MQAIDYICGPVSCFLLPGCIINKYGDRLAPKYVTVEEAELAIARAGGGPAPVTVTASNANGLEAGTTAMVGRPEAIRCFADPQWLTANAPPCLV